ncbi:hypothetical protein RO3G_16296 [Lichtheimia corymbifera JMRC:FSU:9682]|uniref:Hyaluronan/mRNA-binding protein domain-containing protein n=1 Tax=Lichtheimia corymbifera JMRC:FSU:9682 TaxID=1263082 RepID=A0A068RH55_9FUNG|nr:hypothetical protein RO3G_16296 [Lichtheimia corymbifera JMRC:FSU:9682]
MSAFSNNIFDLLNEDGYKPAPVAAPAKEANKPTEAKPASNDKRGKSNGAARGGRRNGRQQNGRQQRGRQFDRHSGTGIADSEKKEKQGWGHPETAEAEAAKDTISPKDPAAEDVAAAEAAEAEEKVKTLEEYLAEKANKSLNVALPEARKANEGADDKKWENAVAFVKEEEPEYFAVNKENKSAKKAADKQRKEKVVIEIEQRFTEKAARGGNRGGRGGERRGGERRGRGNGRRGPKSAAPAVNIQDAAAFPSLGATA